MFLAIFIAFVAVFLLDFLPLLKLKAKKEIIIFLVMFNISLFVTICLYFGIELPTVVKVIDDFMRKIGLTWEK